MKTMNVFHLAIQVDTSILSFFYKNKNGMLLSTCVTKWKAPYIVLTFFLKYCRAYQINNQFLHLYLNCCIYEFYHWITRLYWCRRPPPVISAGLPWLFFVFCVTSYGLIFNIRTWYLVRISWDLELEGWCMRKGATFL